MKPRTQRAANPAGGGAQSVADVPSAAAEEPPSSALLDLAIPPALKPAVAVADLGHRDFPEDPFWQRIPRFASIDLDTFLDPAFQNRHTVTSAAGLREAVGSLVAEAFLDDVEAGLREAPMNMRLSPYVLSRIDWREPYGDPVRRQFLPTASTRVPDHPRLAFDSLHEQADSPTPGLVHRYPDKALFLALDVCPVYCRFCTRSYAIGGSTSTVRKQGFKPQPSRWQAGLAYVASRPEIEDVVLSGGDAFMLPARMLSELLMALLAIPHVRRVRVASKGPAVMPMKILRDRAWTDALCDAVDHGRAHGQEVCLHTHVNSPEEMTFITRQAMNLLFSRGVKVRNQTVLIRGVNDDARRMIHLVRRLSAINVQPYYVYQHDMVKGVEELRTSLAESIELERWVRGATAGFNTPTFVMDAPGGGGKRDLHSYERYDETTGISVYRSPSVDPGRYYVYFDPLDRLPAEGRRRWADPAEHARMIKEVVLAAGLAALEPAIPV
ncbi:MAG TPA: KamA family radical SAM protein [Candidatus Krumholzibacteria bacterium]|nr:KamA family radical SAM protein [Candidatus Krumholzibacteria bacterium]HPD71987.1 KamA family radical SAM protein [Candidatus Krumholzibacteria bacterium]HRY41080.1 KamA family radical SAM protein [Candidatus Krumholzibacteria bacterium]